MNDRFCVQIKGEAAGRKYMGIRREKRMKSRKRKDTALLLGGVLLAASLACGAGVSAEDLVIVEEDGQYAMFDRNDFSTPGMTPRTIEEVLADDTSEDSGWERTYYGEGSGMELSIYGTSYSDTTFAASIYDYGTASYPLQEYGEIIIAHGFNGVEMTQVDENTLDSQYFTLTREDDDTLRMDIKEEYPVTLYRDSIEIDYDSNGNVKSTAVSDRQLWSIEFTDIHTLAENPKEDEWGGSWGYSSYDDYPEEDGYEYYVCLQQIYGTNDYFVATCNYYEYSGMSGWYTTMMEAQDGLLLRFTSGPSIMSDENMYTIYGKNSDGQLFDWDSPITESMLSSGISEEYAYTTFTYLTSKMLWNL